MLTNHRKEGKGALKTDSSEKTELREYPESASMMVQQQHAKVERFLKLGYSHNDILRVLESLHDDAQTNDILEELIKTCHTHTCPSSNKSLPNSPNLVPRGCSLSASQSRPRSERESASAFRPVVIDGSNVAMSHGDKKVFSCQGIQLAVNWFWDKGLQDITVFIPLWRKEPQPQALITDQHILHELEKRKILVYTPSRCVNGKRVVCYDDRYIVKLAFDSNGIIVSNDNYRDLQTENPQWKKFIEERLLMYSFVNDKFMPPDDPLGRNGPTIDDFLRKKQWTPENKLQHCPYGKKCTYGIKCKFYHPERANQSQLSVADELRALSDRAKSSSKPSLQDSHRRLHTPTPPLLSLEDQTHQASPSKQFIYHRDTSSQRSLPSSSLHQWPSQDLDEAFSSMESSFSRLYIQDVPYSLNHSYSSGVASYNHSHDSYSGSFGGSHSHPQSEHPVCSLCRCGQQQIRISSHHHHHLTWGSCPALLPHNGEIPSPFSEKQCFQQPSTRQSHNLLLDPWVQGSLSNGRLSGRAKTLSSEQRNGLTTQLSTLYPQSMVEQVMNDNPHVSDMSELITLIQNNRTSYMFNSLYSD